MQGPIQPEQFRREVNNYSGNFLNIRLKAEMASSDFHMFGPLNNHLGDKSFADDEEVETEVLTWLRQKSKDFYAAGFDALVKRWDKCICWWRLHK
jgi:hypothetical protein